VDSLVVYRSALLGQLANQWVFASPHILIQRKSDLAVGGMAGGNR
jgi:hypothetical protein